MVVGTAGAVAGILNNQRRITNSLESLTNEEIQARVKEAEKLYKKAGVKGGLALVTTILIGGIAFYIDTPYEIPISTVAVSVGGTYGTIQYLKYYFSLYTANEGLRILLQRQSS